MMAVLTKSPPFKEDRRVPPRATPARFKNCLHNNPAYHLEVNEVKAAHS